MTSLEIVPYDANWPAAFEAEAARIRQTLGALAMRIDHHGSTAVPGLAAKPIIDVQISVTSLQPLAPYAEALRSLGYVHVPHPDDAFAPFFHRPSEWPHTHHVHVVELGGREEQRTLAFRDYLRTHADSARRYEALKRRLAAQSVAADRRSREIYAQQKAEYIDLVVAMALGRPSAESALFPHCDCRTDASGQGEVRFHDERQDTQADGWVRLLELIDQAAADGRELFEPYLEMTRKQWSQVVTLPTTIAKLKAVKRLKIYASFLVRIPPEIGEMDSLTEFTPYMSYRLHWFPYEITRCRRLVDSSVSTKAIYGNYKNRFVFPQLEPPRQSTAGLDLENLPPAVYGTDVIKRCSVCDRPLSGAGMFQGWVTLKVATDVLPLLVNACSIDCIARLPQPPKGYVQRAHLGGRDVVQPPPMNSML